MQNLKYVKLPIDVGKVKQNIFLGLTKRQLISFALGLCCGILPFFLFKSIFGTFGGLIALVISALPFVFCGLYEKNGVTFDVTAKLIIQFHKTPRKRLYKSHNTAEYLELISEKQELKRELKNG